MKSCFAFLINTAILLLFQVGPILAQDITFNQVVLSEGPLSLISGITQDPKGYIWFTSLFGLYRYDGYHLINYQHDAGNVNSIADNHLECVYADAEGFIWIGTFGTGLDRYDPSTGVFTHFRNNPKDPSSLSQDIVTVIFEDKEGELWIGTHGGMNVLDRKTGKFIHYRHNNNDTTSLSNDQVRVIYEDHKGVLWIGTGSPWVGRDGNVPGEAGVAGEGGLNRMDRKTGKFIRYLHDPKDPHSITENKVRAIFEDSRGIFWVGTTGADGLQIMNRGTGSFEKYPYDPLHPDRLSRSPVNKEMEFGQVSFITEDPLGSIWIGTKDAGVSRYDPVTQKTKHYDYRDSTSGYNGIGAWVTYTSRDGVLWISSFTDGKLFRLDPLHKSLPHYVLNKGVYSFTEDKEKTLWIRSDSCLIQIDKFNGTKHVFVHDSLNTSGISNDNISSIDIDASDNLWIGTYGGLDRFNRATQSFTHYRHDIKNKNSLISDTIFDVYAGKEQNLWIGTDKGLDLMNTQTGTCSHYQRYNKDTNSLSDNYINSIIEDKQGQLWVGCGNFGGLNKLNPATGKFTHYLKGESIFSLYGDSRNILWVGTLSGLYKFDPASELFSKMSNPSTGENFSFVYTITEDDQKNIWLGTGLGIIKFNYLRNECIIYQKNSEGGDIDVNTSFKDNDGKLFFGDNSGYYAFSPAEFLKGAKPPQILITDFRINNQIMQPGYNSPLKEAIWKVKEIKLNYNQDIFSFDFMAIDYSNPTLNQVMYMLENYDNEWRIGGIDKRAYYFNVPPGKYILKIKAANSNGVWAEKDISVIITPPWWRTWWAYSIFAVLFIGSISGFIYYRSRKLKQQNRILEEKVIQRTQELQQQKEKVESTLTELKSTQAQLIQAEKMASLGELTAGIAHEIQNPLNFVNNFSEVNSELIDELQIELKAGNSTEAFEISNDLKENEQKINHHGRRADAIVKGMLQHSRSSSGKKEPTDINALADEYLRLSYHGMRAKDKLFNATLQKDFDESIGKLNVISQDIGRVLLNLYNNAFYVLSEKKKQLGEGYEPTITVTTALIPSLGGGAAEIRVKDNGNGIPEKVLDKIFQPFFTTKPTGQGTGLGLSLSYDIIKAHGGEIKVETKENEGAEFLIQLPINA